MYFQPPPYKMKLQNTSLSSLHISIWMYQRGALDALDGTLDEDGMASSGSSGAAPNTSIYVWASFYWFCFNKALGLIAFGYFFLV